MKSLKNKKTLVFILAVLMMAAFCLTACTKDTDKEVQNESNMFHHNRNPHLSV